MVRFTPVTVSGCNEMMENHHREMIVRSYHVEVTMTTRDAFSLLSVELTPDLKCTDLRISMGFTGSRVYMCCNMDAGPSARE